MKKLWLILVLTFLVGSVAQSQTVPAGPFSFKGPKITANGTSVVNSHGKIPQFEISYAAGTGTVDLSHCRMHKDAEFIAVTYTDCTGDCIIKPTELCEAYQFTTTLCAGCDVQVYVIEEKY